MAAKRSFLLRLSPELWDELKRWADDELRSVNAQIEYVLRDALRRRRGVTDDDPDDGSDRPESERGSADKR
jgi:hypothetical protein